MQRDDYPVRRALLSVSDKTGIVELARELAALDIELLSTGGTYRLLHDAGLAVREVSDVTGFPEMMDGRVKTLHPKIHGGLLARRGIDDDALRQQGIEPIDLLVVNLYPFEKTVARDDCSPGEAIENIDIGGPAMLRAAAKNHAWVTCVTRAADYPRLLDSLKAGNGCVPAALRRDLAVRVFEHTAAYDGAIANYFGARLAGEPEHFGRTLNLQLHKVQDLRYGENPHQRAAFYAEAGAAADDLAMARQLQGKALSYNNIADTDAALECVRLSRRRPASSSSTPTPAGWRRATRRWPLTSALSPLTRSPPSAASSRSTVNSTPTPPPAIVERQFVEVIVAPAVSEAACEALAAKANVRVLVTGEFSTAPRARHYKRVSGGLLVQDRDDALVGTGELRVVSRREPTPEESVTCCSPGTWRSS
jgi:phosphoribosylaminoimidazolecarboxamide formyltransferase/IMP cyclohydrolase